METAGALDPARRALVRLSAVLGGGELAEVSEALERAAAATAPRAVEETLLQAYLFVGFPPVLRAFGVWRERAGAGPAEPPEEADTERAEWLRRGRTFCRRIYGSAYPQLRRNVGRLHPALDRWMLEEGYGKVLARPGLDPAARELCIVGLLAAAGHGPQLHSHLRGALRVGATAAEVEEAVEAGVERARSASAAGAARALWARVREKAAREGEPASDATQAGEPKRFTSE